MSHNLFFIFEMLLLMLLKERKFVTEQDKASKDAMFVIHLIFQSNLSLKICHTWGGVKWCVIKAPKKVSLII
jgi:hypothetical protein